MAIYLYFRKIAIFYLLMSDNTNLLLLQLKLQKKEDDYFLVTLFFISLSHSFCVGCMVLFRMHPQKQSEPSYSLQAEGW